MFDGLPRQITAPLVEPDARQRGHQFEAGESRGTRVGLAALEDRPSEPAARMRGIDEEGADPGGIDTGIELRLIALGARIAPEERPPPAPSAARHDEARLRHDDEVSAVANQGRVDTERPTERRFDLRRRVVRGAERADRARDEIGQGRLVGEMGSAQPILQDSSSTFPPMAAVLMVSVRSLAKRSR
jgi:hypothetical protein